MQLRKISWSTCQPWEPGKLALDLVEAMKLLVPELHSEVFEPGTQLKSQSLPGRGPCEAAAQGSARCHRQHLSQR